MKFLDVGFTYSSLREGMDAAYRRVMESGWFLNGAELSSFEQAFAAYCRTGHALGVANGLDALTLTLRAIGCGPGDEVIVPAHTFIATWLAVSATGATVVPVDACPQTMNLDLPKVAGAVTQRTKAVIPVHLYGLPTDVERLRAGFGRSDIFVLEDAAQAQGAEVRGERAGGLGDAAAFSFYPGKNMGAFGDAGAVTSGDPDLIRRIRNLANYGAVEKYVHDEKGVNSRLDELQAAFLSVKLAALDGWNAWRTAIAAIYLDGLKDVPGLTLPMAPEGLTSVWHLFVVRTAKRNALAGALAERGVPTQLHYPTPCHLSGAYRDAYRAGQFPVAEAISATCLSLPIGPHLSDDDAHRVVEAVREAMAAIGA